MKCARAGCDVELPPNKAGTRRKWCSERCRKSQYDRACLDCGARVDGTSPGNTKGYCVVCGNRRSGAARTVWTRERVIERIREWDRLFLEPPGVADWSPAKARFMGDEARARRFDDGVHHWPSSPHVHKIFGSWNAAIVAAGFEPRAAHGGAGNAQRRRKRVAA